MGLERTYKDIFGDPLLRVTNRIPEHDVKMTEFGKEKMQELMEEMGADIVETGGSAQYAGDSPEDQWDHTQGFGEAGGGVIMGRSEERRVGSESWGRG